MRSFMPFLKACAIGWATFCLSTVVAVIVLIVVFHFQSGGGSFWATMFILAIGAFGLFLIEGLKFGGIAGLAAFLVAFIWFSLPPDEPLAEADEPSQR